MDRSSSGTSGNRCALMALVAGTCVAAPALGIDRSWNTASGSWATAGNWFPVGVPQAGDHARIGNVAGVENDTVSLNINDTVAALTISDGMMLRTVDNALTVTGNTLVSGSNLEPIFGGGSVLHRSTLLVELFKGTAFTTDDLSLASGAMMAMTHTAFVRVNGVFTIGAGTLLTGEGVIDFHDGGVSFINSGEVRPGDNLGLTLRQFGGGTLDLDGANGDGELDLDHQADAVMRVQAGALTDAFSGVVRFGPNSTLNMEIAGGWTADAASEFVMTGNGILLPGEVVGDHLSFAGSASVSGESAHFQMRPSSLTVLPQARFDVVDARFDLGSSTGSTLIEGGEFDMVDGGSVIVYGETTIRGGEFTTPSQSLTDGFVHLTGATTYDGVVTFNGFAAQGGDAFVAGPTTVHADTFDMDSVGLADWEIDAGLVVNADRIDQVGNHIETLIDIRGTLGARLTINLSDPDDWWVSEGLLRVAGQPALFVTRIAGSGLEVAGDFELTAGRAVVAAPVRFGASSTVTFGAPSAILRLNSSLAVEAGASFSGGGTLQVGAAGDMTLASGASTAGVGLVNQGVLRIGDGAGIAAVDRFQNTGVWAVEIGGYAAGAEYDRLIVSAGEAEMGGTLDVGVIDGFRPVVGDSFTILTAVGGVSGAFPATVVSEAEGWTYEWEVVQSANDVRVRLDAVVPPPCSADFNGDGVVNSQDFFDFLGRFFASDALADFNADSVVNSQDFFDFLTAFFKGCE